MILCITVSKTIKYLGINLTKEVNNLYNGNYKTLIKKLKITQISGKVSVYIGRMN